MSGSPHIGSGLRQAALLAAIAALALGGMLAPDAGASFKGAPGMLAWSDDGNIVVGDPLDPEGTATPVGEGVNPAWSPDGRRIAFSRWDPSICRPAIWVMNADGTGARRVSSPLGGCGGNSNRVHRDSEPSWSSDGKSIVFVRQVQIWKQCALPGGGTYPSYQTSAELVVVGVVSGGESRILERLGSPACSTGDVIDFVLHGPDWSPTGSPIAVQLLKRQGFAGGGSRDTAQLLAVTPGGGSSVIRQAEPIVSDGWSWSPDGSRLAVARYMSPNVDLLDPSGKVVDTLSFPGRRISGLAYSPDGFHVYARVAGTRYEPHDHIVQVPDREVEFDPTEEPDRDPPGPTGGSSVSAAEYDWQPQKQPIIFIHGFAGAKLACGGNELWLPTLSDVADDLLNMRLADNGVSPAPGACAAQPTEIVAKAYALGDVYQSTLDFLDKLKDEEDVPHYEFVWDWRKDPRQQIVALNAKIQEALDKPLQKDQGVKRVTLMGHSMGGLVIRAFLDDPDRAKKVARAVTIGTPYWGAPKSIFPLAAGIETPGWSILDPILPNAEFQQFARNLTGMYFLYPSEHYGPWLSVQGRSPSPFNRAALEQYVGGPLSGNRALLSMALDAHKNVLDGFKRNDVDYRAFVGTGLNTIGAVKFLPGAGGQASAADVTMVNGDGTVPARSGTQGPIGGRPLGDDVPISYVCGVEHVPLPGDPRVDEPLRDFLAFGSPPKKTKNICLNEGAVIHFTGIDLPDARSTASSHVARAAGTTLEDAAQAGKLQLLDLPEEPVAITDDRTPVTVNQPVEGARISITPVHGDGEGKARYYGPVTGKLTLKTTSAGAVNVLDDGRPVSARSKPQPGDPGTGTAPAQPRTLSITYSKRKHAFKGTLKSDAAECVSKQKVTVYKKRRGKDPRVGSDSADNHGKYTVSTHKASGRYYATVPVSKSCLAAKSPTIKV